MVRRGIEDGCFVLTLSDNGVGLTNGLDFRNTEILGLHIMTTLVKQLRGRITINDTACTIAFPAGSSS